MNGGDSLTNLLSINVTLPVDENFPKWILILIVFQVALNLIGLYGLLLFSFIFKKRALMHKNLKILSINTAFLWFIVVLCRLVVGVGALFNWRLIGWFLKFYFYNY